MLWPAGCPSGSGKRVLLLGWAVALPIPLMVWHAPSWGWIVAATVLLGVNQGLLVDDPERQPGTWEVFAVVSWRDRRLFALSQAGLVEKFVRPLV